MSPVDVGVVLFGLVALVAGADVFVRGAAGLAERLGTPPLVIGLTVVAAGTSAPELAVTVGAAATGAGDVALGNVVGSNLFNLLLVLGLTGMVGGLVVDRSLLRLEAPLLVLLTGATVLLGAGGFTRVEGAVLLAGAGAFTVALLVRARRAPDEPDVLAEPAGHRPPWLDGLLLAGGLGLLVVGARAFVGGATQIATDLGVSEAVVGLTVVAAGTSLPELATSLVAAGRGQRDIAVGNVLGSNLANVLLVLGAGAVVATGGVLPADPDILAVDLPLLVLAQLLVWPMLLTGARISRVEGVALVAAYGGYVALVLGPRVLGA